ncbi:hypothetical protein [Poseidonibacter antarcticus]|uniref:hypothetical protein n=1 Tax=Poseidonibacter antarcticus TaxID=2478538 RepID=UPI000EF544CA|nr:hypothetical protein [Poseidonibacter antarcticus]
MLKSIGNNFVNSSIKVKIQLYILPLFFIYFYIYFYTGTNKEYIQDNRSKLDGLLTKKFNKSYLEIIKKIENYSNLEKIKIISIEYKNKNLLIKGKTTLLKIKSLIRKLEIINNYSNIILVNILTKGKRNEYSFEINTEFKKYYIKDKNKTEKKDKVQVVKKISKDIFKLNAIVSNYILLNNKWYTLKERVGKYKIIEIKEKSVILDYKGTNLNLKLYKNE